MNARANLATLTLHSGPEFSPTAATGMGLLSAQPLLLSTPAGAGAVELPLPATDSPTLGSGLIGHLVTETDELNFSVFPEAAEIHGDDVEVRWAATFISLDVFFQDGSRLSELPVVDQYGAALNAQAQGEARRTWVDQWNLRTVSLRAAAGKRIAEVVVVGQAHQQSPFRCWVDQITVTEGTCAPQSLLEAVDTRRGTHSSGQFSRGNNAPLVGLPHGGVFGLPLTDASSRTWPYSWHAHSRVDAETGRVRPSLQGFGTSHIPSPWMQDRGVFILAPHTTTTPPAAQTPESRQERALWFDHQQETANAHQYRVDLYGQNDHTQPSSITTLLSAAHHAIGLSCDFEQAGSLVLDHRGEVSGAQWNLQDGVLELSGVLADRKNAPEEHIALRVHPVTAEHLSAGEDMHGLGGYLSVGPGPVEAVLALSEVSTEAAWQHVNEAANVSDMHAAATGLWADVLGRVEVNLPELSENLPAQRDRMTTLASNLYRIFAYPNRAGEPDAQGRLSHRNAAGTVMESPIAADQAPEVAAGELTVTNGFWDTYRTEWPMLGLVDAPRTGELASGLLGHFEDYGWMPRWSAPGPWDVMTGTSSDIVFADLLVRGVPGVDWLHAYRTAVRHGTCVAPDKRVGRKGLHPGIFRGYINTDTPEGMSWTLDNSINDAGAARLAAHLISIGAQLEGHDLPAEAEYFARRGLGYRNVFHPGHQFFIGRTAGGDWREDADYNPDVWGFDYTETNGWGTRFTAPHDPTGLLSLYGSEEALGAALDATFARPELADESTKGSYGGVIHEQKEARDCRQGMVALSNQPAHHIPFIYMAAGQHDTAHQVVADVLRRHFIGSDIGQGYAGDEDNGEMSAWWLFAGMGLYPLVPASGEYVLTPPIWRDFSIELRPGGADPAPLRVTTSGPLPLDGPSYIRSLSVDGQPWEQISLPHERVARGAHLHFDLSSEPCGWAADSRPAGLSERLEQAGYRNQPWRDVAIGTSESHHQPLVDDTGADTVTLAAGETVELLIDTAQDLGDDRLLYTMSLKSPTDTGSWRVSSVSEDGTETVLDERKAEVFSWPEQTRPFAAPLPGSELPGRLRFTATAELTLRQLEILT